MKYRRMEVVHVDAVLGYLRGMIVRHAVGDSSTCTHRGILRLRMNPDPWRRHVEAARPFRWHPSASRRRNLMHASFRSPPPHPRRLIAGLFPQRQASPARSLPAAKPRQDETVGGVFDFAPGQFRHRITGEQWLAHRRKLDPHPNGPLAL